MSAVRNNQNQLEPVLGPGGGQGQGQGSRSGWMLGCAGALVPPSEVLHGPRVVPELWKMHPTRVSRCQEDLGRCLRTQDISYRWSCVCQQCGQWSLTTVYSWSALGCVTGYLS